MIKSRKSRLVLISLFAVFALTMYLMSAVRITAFDGNMYAGLLQGK